MQNKLSINIKNQNEMENNVFFGEKNALRNVSSPKIN